MSTYVLLNLLNSFKEKPYNARPIKIFLKKLILKSQQMTTKAWIITQHEKC